MIVGCNPASPTFSLYLFSKFSVSLLEIKTKIMKELLLLLLYISLIDVAQEETYRKARLNLNIENISPVLMKMKLSQMPPLIELCGTEVLQDSYSKEEIFNLRICFRIKGDTSVIKAKVYAFDVNIISNGTRQKTTRIKRILSYEFTSLIKRASQGDVIIINNVKFVVNKIKIKSQGSISFKIK